MSAQSPNWRAQSCRKHRRDLELQHLDVLCSGDLSNADNYMNLSGAAHVRPAGYRRATLFERKPFVRSGLPDELSV
jgi:hypothetical protein